MFVAGDVGVEWIINVCGVEKECWEQNQLYKTDIDDGQEKLEMLVNEILGPSCMGLYDVIRRGVWWVGGYCKGFLSMPDAYRFVYMHDCDGFYGK